MARLVDSAGHRFISGLGKLRFSPIEKRDLLKSWFAISLAFTIYLIGPSLDIRFWIMMVVAAITVGLGFLLHELAHKAVAVHFGLWAEYRAFDTMLWLAIVLSFFRLLFVAPGAVFITGRGLDYQYVPIEQNGKISVAGPLMNYILAVVFLLMAVFIPLTSPFAMMGAQVNSWLGLFNLIPFLNFDGQKIWAWNKVSYGCMVLIGAGLMYSVSVI